MLKEAIEKIVSLAQAGIAPNVTTYGGRNYQAGPHLYEQIDDPRCAPIEVHTLQAVNDYLKMNKDTLTLAGVVVHVVNHRHVTVAGPLRADRQRECYLSAKPVNDDLLGTFLNKFQRQEDFILGVQQHFVDQPGRAELLATVGNLSTEKARTLVDDGVTQEVSTKASAVRSANTVVKHPILVPRRSFPEIQLEGVQFILRMTGGGDGQMPAVGLFECDGGAWRVDAIEKIAAHITEAAGAEAVAWGVLS